MEDFELQIISDQLCLLSKYTAGELAHISIISTGTSVYMCVCVCAFVNLNVLI